MTAIAESAKGRIRTIRHECANRLDAQANRQNGLPPLQGSPKQVAWAESIRRKRMKAASEYAVGSGDNRLIDAVITLSTWTQAAHWIGRREASIEYLLSEAIKNPEIGRKPFFYRPSIR